MATTSSIQLFVALLVTSLLSHVAGHSYMTEPLSRSNQAQSNAGCRGPSCLGPCDVPLSKATRAPIVASRGQSIRVNWPRNNHAGGFIRFAWAPTAQSDSHAAFDNHVQQINCHEIGNPTPGQCAPIDPVNDINGGGSGPGDGSSGACNTNISVPLDLTDGLWTLQWAWFGGAFSLGDYYSCADYKISGGAVGTLTPVFIGGDFSYPNQPKCKFFNTDKLHVCTNEPCQQPIYPAVQPQSGPPAAGQLGPSSSSSSSTPSTPSTPSVPAPLTTSRTPVAPVQPSSTGAAHVPTVTTNSQPVQMPMTTGRAQSPSVATTATATPVVTSANCAGASSLSSSTARITSLDTWGSEFHALIEIDVSEAILSNWVLEITFPFSTQIVSYFNGGALQCATSNTAYFMPAASWANNKVHGSMVQVEIIAANNGSPAALIQSGIGLRVLKH